MPYGKSNKSIQDSAFKLRSGNKATYSDLQKESPLKVLPAIVPILVKAAASAAASAAVKSQLTPPDQDTSDPFDGVEVGVKKEEE